MPIDAEETARVRTFIPQKNGIRQFVFRVTITAAALALWFWTQSLISARSFPGSGITDWTHSATSSANNYLYWHPAAANALLILSSAMIDLTGIFLLSRWMFQGEARPFISLVIVLGLRQMMQFCVSLPAPPQQIWHDPGFPSLLVTYHVANDYFFSGHTAIAVVGAIEFYRITKPWGALLGVILVVFEIATVLVLRAHYAMDIFTGVVTGLYASRVTDGLIGRLKRKP